jgi:hypothetical protein
MLMRPSSWDGREKEEEEDDDDDNNDDGDGAEGIKG